MSTGGAVFYRLLKTTVTYILISHSKLRVFFLRLMGVGCRNIVINGKIIVWGRPSFLTIGENSSINAGVFFQLLDTITIGKNVHISPYAQFYTGRLKEIPAERAFHSFEKIAVHNNVWIGANAIILGGVTIGENSIIGAHSLVNINIPPNVLAAGNPVKIIRPIKTKVSLGK